MRMLTFAFGLGASAGAIGVLTVVLVLGILSVH